MKKEMSTVGGKRLLILLAVSSFFIGLDSLVVSPITPQILKSTHTPIDKAGLLITAYALLYGLTAPLFGPISDKVGRRKMIVIGMLIFSMGTFCTGIANDFYTILLFRALTGLSGAIVMPSIFALVGDTFTNKNRGMAMGVVMGAMIGSTVLGVPIGAYISGSYSWKWTFYALGVLAFLVFLIDIIGLPRTVPPHQMTVSPIKSYFHQLKTVFTNFSVLLALLATLFWTIGLQGMFSYIGVFYNTNFHLEVGGVGTVILLAGVSSVIGNIVGGKMSDKLGRKNMICMASLTASISVIIFSTISGNLILAVIVHVVWSGIIGLGQSSLTALISELNAKVRGTVMSLNSSAMYLGMTIASSISSLLLAHFTFVAVGILCAISAILVIPIITRILITENRVEVSSSVKQISSD